VVPLLTGQHFAGDVTSPPGLGSCLGSTRLGGKHKRFGISKRGNIYLRRMLIHGARAVLFRVNYDTGGFGQWVHRLTQPAPRDQVIVAIANKLARIAWAVLSSGKDYRHQPLQLAAA
jgi:transposase